MYDRDTVILEMLSAQGRVEVAALADRLRVSRVTVRKDLDRLETRGLIRREHGWAVIGSPEDIAARMAFHYDVKLRIAQLAAQDVRDGQTVMIESGSCCALLAEVLATERREITIVTNSAFIAGHIRNAPGARVVLLGGEYQAQAQVMVGPMTRLCAERFSVGRLFVGADGFRRPEGFTGGNMLRAEAVQAMARQAEEVVVLTESSKFRQRGVVNLLRAQEVGAVYTDPGIPEAEAAWLRLQGVRVHTIVS